MTLKSSLSELIPILTNIFPESLWGYVCHLNKWAVSLLTSHFLLFDITVKFAKWIRLRIAFFFFCCSGINNFIQKVSGKEITLFVQDKDASLVLKVKYHRIGSRCNHWPFRSIHHLHLHVTDYLGNLNLIELTHIIYQLEVISPPVSFSKVM